MPSSFHNAVQVPNDSVLVTKLTISGAGAARHGFVNAHSLLSQAEPQKFRILSTLDKTLLGGVENDAELSSYRLPSASEQEWETNGNRRSKKSAGRSRTQTKNLQAGVCTISAVANGTGSVEKATVSKNQKRSKKPQKDEQSTIKSIKITKPGTSKSSTKRTKQLSTKSLPRKPDIICEDKVVAESMVQSKGDTREQTLELSEAIQRKAKWTPVKNTAKERSPVDEIEAAWSLLMPDSPSALGKPPDIAPENIAERYLYASSKSDKIAVSLARDSHIDRPITKKRRLDVRHLQCNEQEIWAKLTLRQLVQGVASTKSKLAPAKRSGSPKKKPQTITEKSTAQFAQENLSTTSTLRDYFVGTAESQNPTLTSVLEHAVSEGKAKVVRSEKSGRTRGPKAKPKSKVKAPVNLLSPERAMERANEQDLLFGTSSQLAREESPAFIRDLQRAFKESEAIGNMDDTSEAIESQATDQSFASNTSTTKSCAASRNLWAVAARDSQGLMLDVDTVDLANTPKTTRLLSTKIDQTHEEDHAKVAPTAPSTAADERWKAAGDTTTSEGPTASSTSLGDVETLLPRSIAEASLRQRPKSRSPVKKQQAPKDERPLETTSSVSQRPNHRGFTDIELRKVLAAFGFKNIRGREKMIALLEECWDSIDGRALRTLSSNVPVPPSVAVRGPSDTASSPDKIPKKRGRPPKKSAALGTRKSEAASSSSPKKSKGRPRKSSVEQPSETNAQITATNERCAARDSGDQDKDGSPSLDTSPKPPRDHSISAKTAGRFQNGRPKTAGMTAQEVETLFVTIAKAVKTYPPTHDVDNLTWYEKILLYDPIVFEDLAEWLNQTGLPRVGYDHGVSPLMVKSWCESQSVCCLWRENLRGGTRARY
ncbi:MAG: hypothetical protein Q9222_001313 [Ikaeria aurantiellina]